MNSPEGAANNAPAASSNSIPRSYRTKYSSSQNNVRRSAGRCGGLLLMVFWMETDCPSVLEGILRLFARLLQVGLGLVLAALGLQVPVVRCVAGLLLDLAL